MFGGFTKTWVHSDLGSFGRKKPLEQSPSGIIGPDYS